MAPIDHQRSVIVTVFPTANPVLNLATEEFLLTEKTFSGPLLYFYENNDAVILGRSLFREKEIHLKKNLFPVLKRISGGGTVMHFRGNLNYGLILNLTDYPELNSIADSFRILCGVVAESLSPWLPLAQRGSSDLSLKQLGLERKISGNSQARKKGKVLHHGTVLYRRDNLHKISAALRPPEKQPEYREKRSHRDFLIRTIPPAGRAGLQSLIIRGFARHFHLPVKFQNLDQIISHHDERIIRQEKIPQLLARD